MGYKNPDKHREYHARYREEHREELRAKDRLRRPRKPPKPRQTPEEAKAWRDAWNAKRTAEGYWSKFYQQNKEKRKTGHRLYQLMKQYGLTGEDYERMFDAQQGLCAICQKPESDKYPSGVRKRLNVDHDHETGKVRALLCRACNVGIGNLGDRSETVFAAAVYLAEHGA